MNTNQSNILLVPENILRKHFSNGVTVLIHENPWSNTAAICGSIMGGHCLESPEQVGLSKFMSAALTAGTQSRTSSQIRDYLENRGASLSFISGPHAINIKGRCLTEDLTDVLQLLKEMLSEPVFPEQELEAQKKLAFDTTVVDPDVGDSISYDMFKGFLWGPNHPYGRGKYGDEEEEENENLTRDDLMNFHRRFIGPKNLILAISGNFRGLNIMDCCEEIFGRWTKTQEDVDEDAIFHYTGREEDATRIHVELTDAKEIFFILGSFGPAVSDPDYMSAKLGNCILGEFGLAGRIGRVVREKNGLAYDVCSYLDSKKKGGCWSVQAGVAPEDFAKAGNLIFDELKRFTTEPVSLKELEDVKAWYLGSLPLEFRTNAGMAAGLFNLEFYQLGLDHYLRIPERIHAITPEMILETAKKWIDPQNMIKFTAGAMDDIQKADWW